MTADTNYQIVDDKGNTVLTGGSQEAAKEVKKALRDHANIEVTVKKK
jgi:hypothetical protein